MRPNFVYASRIGVPNCGTYTRPNFVYGYASQIDVPIRVPNELFIKVLVVRIVCIRVPNWCTYTRPKLTSRYASRMSYLLRDWLCVLCVYASQIGVRIRVPN